MNIKSVRFPCPVAVVKGDARVEFEPGRRGVREIRLVTIGGQHFGDLLFVMADGSHSVIQRVPGTILSVDNPAETSTGTFTNSTAKEISGPTSSSASAEPPPARPIPKSGRVQR